MYELSFPFLGSQLRKREVRLSCLPFSGAAKRAQLLGLGLYGSI